MNNKKAIEYAHGVHDSFLEVMEPLLSNTPINGFGYMEFLSPEKVFHLCTDLIWLQDYLASGHMGETWDQTIEATTPEEVDPSFLWSILDSQDPIEQYCASRGHRFGINISHWDGEKLKLWIFTAKDPNSFLFFQNQRGKLDTLVTQFNHLGQDLICEDRATKNAAHLLKPREATSRNLMLTLEKQKVCLTPRQWKVLYLYAHGFRMKEIARNMDISPRTAESVIQTIRSKTSLLSRSQLMALVNQKSYF